MIAVPWLSTAVQDPTLTQVPAGAAPSGLLGWMYAFASRPGVVETLVAMLVVGLGLWIGLRLTRIVAGVRGRAQLEDYLLGVEQALAGDLEGAHQRLARVLEVDPENHYARMLLGKVLAEQGEAAQAHKHHLYLQRAFGVESGENDLQLARALLQCGRPAEAAAAAARVVATDPRHQGAHEFLFRAHLQAGDHEAAAASGRRLLALSGPPAGALRTDVAAALAGAGELHLRRGDVAAAQQALEQARALASDHSTVQLFAARLDAAQRGLATAALPFLMPPPTAKDGDLPVPTATGRMVARAAGQPLAPMTTVAAWLPALAPLLPAGRWRCGACGSALAGARAQCPRCGVEGRAEVDEPNLFLAVATPGHLADAIEANAAHVRRTVRAALAGAATPMAPAAVAARQGVAQLGERAVGELLASACGSDQATTDVAIGLLQQLGPAITPALFAAADELEDGRLLPIGTNPIAHVVGRVVQGFDRAALPHVETLFASARPSSRKILIDYFLGLADPQEFQVVLERFPPIEILHRLNKIDSAVLRRFLQAVPPDHFVADVLLLESTFYREDELLAAIPGAQHPAALERVLVQRGPSRTLTSELLRALGEAALRPVALRVLQAFSGRVLDHLLAAFVDRDRSADVRGRLAELLAGLGPASVDRLCASFGPEPTSLDDELRSVLVTMGDDAVPALQSAYSRPGVIERLTVGLFGRSHNRRAQIVRALASIGSPVAKSALRSLREHETDANLKLRLQQALHRLEEKHLAAGADGVAAAAPAPGPTTGTEPEGGRHEQVG